MDFYGTKLTDTALVLVDIQERLLKLMKPKIWDSVLPRILLLTDMLQFLERPVFVTEQYPEGLGSTVKAVKDRLNAFQPLEKSTFSCWGQVSFQENLRRSGAGTVVLTGMEAHICIHETAMDLKKNGFNVIVPADAVISSGKLKWQTGLRQMEQAGIHISSSETVLFHLLGSCNHPAFGKMISLLKEISTGN